MQKKKSNIVLIGMAGAGKSTVGAALAEVLHLDFVDIDKLIEKDQQASLQELLDQKGTAGFRALEEQVILAMQQQHHVIATGGSAIYSSAAMEHLKRSSLFVLLDVSFSVLEQRVGNFSTRGLVKTKAQSFSQLYDERLPLYHKYADIVTPCDGKTVTDICHAIKTQIVDSFYL